MKILKKLLVNLILSLSSGLFLTLSFPKFNLYWLAWFALVPLLISIRNKSSVKSFFIGFVSGLIHYLTLLYWLSYTLKTYVHFSSYSCILIHLLLSVYLAIYFGGFSIAVSKLCEKPLKCIFFAPMLWITFEYTRSFFFLGFPWGVLGYTQYLNINLIQLADITGVLGLSFLIVLININIVFILLYIANSDWQGIKLKKQFLYRSTFFIFLIFGFVFFYGNNRIQCIDNLISKSPSANVSVIQGNIDQSIKWDPFYRTKTIRKYIDLSIAVKPNHPDLVIWPETAVPFYFYYEIERSRKIYKAIKEIGSDFIIGSPSLDHEGDVVKYYNTAYLVSADGKVTDRYNKVHLVPFGEYMPLRSIFKSAKILVSGDEDFSPGKEINPLKWNEYKIGVQICYEAIFPDIARNLVKNGAQVLVNITNDAWFGNTSGAYQHFSMAIFRAIENRRTLIRSANTGISGFIDPAGRIIEKTPLFKETYLTRKIPIIKDFSFYSRFGDIFVFSNILFIFIYIIIQIFKNYRLHNG